jgi:hypothetical protein
MAIELVSISTPANLNLFKNTAASSTLTALSVGSVKLLWAEVNNVNNGSAVYLKIYGQTAPGSEIVPGLVESGGSRLSARYATCTC